MFARRPAATVTTLQSLRERARLATEASTVADAEYHAAEDAAELLVAGPRERAKLAADLADAADGDFMDAQLEALRLDAIESGDCDADGEPVAYDRYYGGV